MMFPDRAPSGQYLYTTFIGGSRNRELAEASLYVQYWFLGVCMRAQNLILKPHLELNIKMLTPGKFYFIILNNLSYNLRSDELKQVVISDLRKLLGTEGQPTFVK